jgi:S-adenosylmethionine decarboxylase
VAELPASGSEWVVDALGCDPDKLRSVEALSRLFDEIVRDLGLHPIGAAAWHKFPGAGGVTGLLMLKESHLACHTFPEHASLCINLFCCRERAPWPWEDRLAELVGAAEVRVRRITREYSSMKEARP